LAVLGSDEPEGTLVSSFDAFSLGDAVSASLENAIDPHMTLLPGDLIACGTSVGVGVMKDPVNTVTVAIDGIGELTNEFSH
jgi:hypothetical protein